MVARVAPLSVSVIETSALGNTAPVESVTFPLTCATATACGNAGTANKEIVNKQSMLDKAAKTFMKDLHLCVPQCEILYRATRLAKIYTEDPTASTVVVQFRRAL